MSWEPQGLVKYECNNCEKQFIVGLIDDRAAKPKCCPFCGSESIEDVSFVEPDEDNYDWLFEMGCAGIHYDPDTEDDVQTAQLFLADLEGFTDQQVREHIAYEYEASMDYIDKFDILIAYESVGSWGCDSSSFFLLRDKTTGELFENHGSHCSCYGFEGQFEPEKTTTEYLVSDCFFFECGGYDEDDERHRKQVSKYLQRLITNAEEGDSD